MLKNILLLSLVISSAAFASNKTVKNSPQFDISLEDDAGILAKEVLAVGPYLTANQRAAAQNEIRLIRAIIFNSQLPVSTPTPSPTPVVGAPVSMMNYTCVARDNDDRAPFVIGVRNGLNVTRVMQTVYDTLTACQSTISSMKNFGYSALICTSRDSDGRDPWVLGMFSGQGTFSKIAHSATSTAAECQTLLNSLVPAGNAALYCTSRDDDARSPFTAASVDLITGQVTRGTEVYSTIAECSSFINGH